MDIQNTITVTEIVRYVAFAVGGGFVPSIVKIIFGLESSKIKSLTNIIDELDKRVRRLEDENTRLEKRVDSMSSERYSLLIDIGHFKYAADGMKMCPFYQQTGECIMHKRYYLIKEETSDNP